MHARESAKVSVNLTHSRVVLCHPSCLHNSLETGWVFAAVFTSIMRCLGFCTRTVIGMNSGLDVDLDGIVMGGDEFVWNFHVWAEIFVNGGESLFFLSSENGAFRAPHAIRRTNHQQHTV